MDKAWCFSGGGGAASLPARLTRRRSARPSRGGGTAECTVYTQTFVSLAPRPLAPSPPSLLPTRHPVGKSSASLARPRPPGTTPAPRILHCASRGRRRRIAPCVGAPSSLARRRRFFVFGSVIGGGARAGAAAEFPSSPSSPDSSFRCEIARAQVPCVPSVSSLPRFSGSQLPQRSPRNGVGLDGVAGTEIARATPEILLVLVLRIPVVLLLRLCGWRCRCCCRRRHPRLWLSLSISRSLAFPLALSLCLSRSLSRIPSPPGPHPLDPRPGSGWRTPHRTVDTAWRCLLRPR